MVAWQPPNEAGSLLVQVPSFPDRMFENRIPGSSNSVFSQRFLRAKSLATPRVWQWEWDRTGEAAPHCRLDSSKELCSETSTQKKQKK